ncbi:MAG: precorrin-3B synthase [Nitratireductor sp.]
MNASQRRGACPSLSAPMETGDGLLIRLQPLQGGVSPAQLAGLAEAAARFGNGMMEVTARGSLQIRGLTSSSAGDFAAAVDRLGIAVRGGVPVETGPLAGLDPSEAADPRPLAEKIRAGIAASGLAPKLAPKITVIVDGGGALTLGDLIADLRLTALGAGCWRLAVGGTAARARVVGVVTGETAHAAIVTLLETIAAKGGAARGRDLAPDELAGALRDLAIAKAAETDALAPALPVGRFALKGDRIALGIALSFGQVHAGALAGLADAAGRAGIAEIRFAPGRGLLLLAKAGADVSSLRQMSAKSGFVVDADDPRLSVVACAGQPACAAGRYRTRETAAAIIGAAAGLLDGSLRLHLSGCAKRCAQPARPGWTLLGGDAARTLTTDTADRYEMRGEVATGEEAGAFARLTAAFKRHRKTGETAAAFLARQDASTLTTWLRRDPT